MPRIQHMVLAILGMGLVGSDVLADGRRGAVLSEATTAVALDDKGRPAVGGRFGLEVKPTPKGVLLVIRIPCQGSGPPRVRYLAYPTERGAAAAVRVVREPGPGCYWAQTCCESHTCSEGLAKNRFVLDQFSYGVKDGPFQSFELQQGKQKRLVLGKKKRPMEKDRFVGRTIKYDNLDDGK
jgi:hypothetical protein